MRVRADQPTFREVTFTPGFNVILAERTMESTKKDCRNGLGKSMLIEIISFCLGAKPEKTGLGHEALSDWSFTLDMHLRGQTVSVTRATRDAGKVFVEGDTTGWPIQPARIRSLAGPSSRLPSGLDCLETSCLACRRAASSSDYAPTFRSLISYFIRRGKDAYSIAFEHYRKQNEWDKQVNNAFLLGLAWEDASEWQRLRDKKASLEELKKAQKKA